MKDIHSWLKEYSVSHQNPTNKKIHWVCVPVIFFTVVGLLDLVKLSDSVSLAQVVLVAAVGYYWVLSRTLAVGMSIFSVVCLVTARTIQNSGVPLLLVCLTLFTIAWLGQFYGHKIEGKRPSFLKDLQFLLIGPAWLLSFIYTKLGIRI